MTDAAFVDAFLTWMDEQDVQARVAVKVSMVQETYCDFGASARVIVVAVCAGRWTGPTPEGFRGCPVQWTVG